MEITERTKAITSKIRKVLDLHSIDEIWNVRKIHKEASNTRQTWRYPLS